MRILLIKLRHIGDVLLTTPTIKALHDFYPESIIDVLVYKETEAILKGNKNINTCYTVDRLLKYQGIRKQIPQELNLLKSLRANKYDLVINLSEQWRSALYCLLLSSPNSIAFEQIRRHFLPWRICHKIVVRQSKIYEQQHTVINNLSILTPLGITMPDTSVKLAYSSEELKRVNELCRIHRLDKFILLQPTARWAFKTWSPEHFSSLINILTDQGEKVVISAGKQPEDTRMISLILSQCHSMDRIVNLAGKLTLTELGVLLRKATLFVGVDSVPMHMAAAVQTPSVVLFGPTAIKQWHPWNAPHSLIWAGSYRFLPSPHEVDTNTPERYIDAIPVSHVVDEVNKWLYGNKINE